MKPEHQPTLSPLGVLNASADRCESADVRSEPVLYQHALAYLLGLEGVALLRAFAGEHGRAFVEERFEEMRELLDSAELFGDGADVSPISTVEGYADWAPTYDTPGNSLIDIEQPIVREIVNGLPVGIALDVACGTGRHTEYLLGRGHQVIAVDSSAEMLERAEQRAPAATFHQADLWNLPLADARTDLVVCALALTHAPDLNAAFAEFARVLRPGGHIIVSDAVGLAAGVRPPILVRSADGKTGYMPHHNRSTGDYLRAALRVGLEVRRCDEPRSTGPLLDPTFAPSRDEMLAADAPNIWLLHYWNRVATNAAMEGEPRAVIWHFQLGTTTS